VALRGGPAVSMAVGTVAVGAAGYGFVSLTGHVLAPVDAAALASVYLLINIIGPGLFFALEQETSRATSVRLAVYGTLGPVVRNGLLLAGGVLAVVLAALFALSGPLTERVLAGQTGLFLAVVLSVVTSAMVYLTRGLLGGLRRFPSYAATLTVEGLARLLPCVALTVFGGATGLAYALVFAAGSAVGALAGLPGVRRGAPDPATAPDPTTPDLSAPAEVPASVSLGAMARGLGLLLGGTLLMQAVANLAPIVVTARLGTAGAATAAAFAAAFVLVRVPLFLFAPVQAMLLPDLTRAAAAGDFAAVRARVRTIVLAVLAIGLPSAALAALVGPQAARLLFGAKIDLSGSMVGLLGLGTVALMIAQALQPGLVAIGRHRHVTIAWGLSTVTLVAMLVLPGSPVAIAAFGQVVASSVVAVGMAVALRAGLGSRARSAPSLGPEPVR